MLGITEVIENLYISGLETSTAILNKGIRSVINISSECPAQDLGPLIDYKKIHIPDLPTASIQIYFDRLADRIEENLQQGKKTLVHCYVGRSRSASIILAYLMKYRQMSLRDAFYFLRSRRSIVGPNFGFIKQLINYEKSLFGTTSVSFIDTNLGSIPDIYLSNSRRETPIPIKITRKTTTANNMTRPSSFIERPTHSGDSTRMIASVNHHSAFMHDQPRLNSALLLERFPSARLNALRTGKYVPQFFLNRYSTSIEPYLCCCLAR